MSVITKVPDMMEVSKDYIDTLIKIIQNYLENTSTTRLLVKGLSVLSITYVMKNWIHQLRQYKKNNLGGPMPLPLFGNLLMYRKGLNYCHLDLVNNYGKTFLLSEGLSSPLICTADPDFIKAVAIKDFRYFVNRRRFQAFELVEPMNRMLSTLRNEEWKNIRSIVTSAFSGSKLKKLSSCIVETCSLFNKHLEGLTKTDGIMDVKRLYSCFASDVVCSAMFGVPIDTVNESEHPLQKNIQRIFGPEIYKNWRFIMLFFLPSLTNYLMKNKIIDSLVPSEPLEYLIDLTNQIIEERRSKEKFRNDFIQMMVDHEDEAKDEIKNVESNANSDWKPQYLKNKLTNGEILSQAILFMMVGTETTAVTLGYTSYNLAMNPTVQDKLVKEIDLVLEKHNGSISYESVNEMEYLSSVINETQRMYSFSHVDREAAEDYEYNGIKVKKGQTVNMLIFAMQHDEGVYPEAFKFNPDREKCDNFTPFGSGPRMCIASRFAILEIKLLLATILSKYRFEKCDKTPANITMDSSTLSKPNEHIFLKILERLDTNNN